MSDKDLKKMPRGSYDCRCNGKVYVVKWKDSAIVCFTSNCVNHEPEQVVQRRVGRAIEKVKQPMLVRKYNQGMGGVDLMDKLLGSYRQTFH